MNGKFVKWSAALALAATVTAGVGIVLPTTFADAETTVETATVVSAYEAGQNFSKKLKFVGNEASVTLKTAAAAPEKLVLFGFYQGEGTIPDANGAGKNKGISLIGYATGELELYNNVGWKQLTQAAGTTQLFPDKAKVTFTLARETVEGSTHYKLYYTPDGGEKTLWNDLSSGLTYNGYTYDFSDDDVMTADGCTYFGANVFTDARNLEIFETKTTVKGVSFVNGTNAKVVEAYDAQGNAYPVSANTVTETGYEFTTAQAFTPVSVKLENGYGKTATAALTDTEIRFASDSFATGTYEFTQSVTQNQQWNAFDNGGLVTVTDEDGIDLQLGVQGSGGNFGIFFLPTNGVGWPTAIPANGFCVFFTNAEGNRLCPEVYMNYQGNGWLQLTTTSDPNDASFPKIDPAAPGSSDWTNMKFSLKKVGGEWGIYLNDVLVPFKGHSQLAGTPYAEHIGKSFNPLAVAFPDAEWRNAEGKTNFGVSGWSGDNAVKFYVPRVGVTAAVTDLYGAAEKYAAMKACDAQGREVSLLGGNLTETGLEYISYDVGRIAKLTLETAGGVKSEFAVDYASKTADERVTLGSAETTYDKTLTVKDKDGAAVAGASLTVKDGETDVTGYIKTIDNGDGTYTIKGINKSLTVTAEKGGANGTVALDKESAEKEVSIYKEYSLNITLKSGTGALLENMQDALSVYTDENKENASVIYDAESKVYVISGLYETNGVKTVRFSAEGYAPAKTTVTSASVSAELTAVRLYSTQVTLSYTYGEGEGKRTVAIAGAEDYLKVYDSATASQPAEGFAVTYAEGVYTVSGIREDSAEAKFIKFEMENYGVRTASVTFDTAAQGVSMTTTHTYSAVIEVLDDNGGVIEDAVIITDADGDFVYDEETKTYVLGGQTDVVEATVTAAGYSGRTVSLNPETQKVTVTLADTSALKAAIDAAKAAKQNVAVSADGSEIDVSQKWTTKANLDALNAAIEAAEEVYADAAADKDALAAARTALDAAVTAFNAEVKDGTKAEVPVDKTALEAAIDAAENAKKSAAVSADGKDVEPDKKWTTQQALDALTAAVDTAKTAAAKEGAAQAEIDAAKAALEKAVADFNAGLKNGTKTAEGSSSEGSSSTSESGGCGSSIAVGGMLAAAVVCGAALLLKRRRG